MPTQIRRVHPGRGEPGSEVDIVIEFDPPGGGGTPDIAAVVFNSADAPQYNVTERDSTNHTLTFHVTVPATATTGPIEVDLRAPAGSPTTYPPVRTVQDFTVDNPNHNTFRVTNVLPNRPTYNLGDRVTIVTYPALSNQQGAVSVYFPSIANGPAILQAQPLNIRGNQIALNIPNRAKTGRAKVSLNVQGGQAQSAVTKQLTIL